MTLVAALGRIDDIQQRIRSLSPEAATTDTAAAAAATTGGTGGTGSATANAFASAVRDAGGVGDVPALPAGPVDGADIVAQAKEYLGVPYVFGGEDRSGMDCSGLVQRVLADLGIDAPRVVQDQADIGVEVPSLADARPGDLIVTQGEGHIVIYAGDGMVIHAPSPGKYVEIRDNWLKDGDIATIRRVVPPPGEGGAVAGVTASAPASAFGLGASGLGASASPASATAATGGPSAALTAVAARTTLAMPPATSGGTDAGAVAALSVTPALSATVTGATVTGATVTGSGGGATATTPATSAEPASSSAVPSAAVAAAGLTPVAGSPAIVSAPSAPPASPAAAQPPLAPQLTTPLVNLARSGQGEHTLTLRVSPEDLGPVTVTARITGSSVTIELASATTAGRDALRALLVDLRRDLAVLVPHSSIAVTAADAPRADQLGTGTGGTSAGALGASTSGQSFGQGASDGSARERGAQTAPAASVVPLPPDVPPLPAPTAASATGIDLFA